MNKLFKPLCKAFAVILIAGLSSGCGKDEPTPSGGNGGSQTGPTTVAVTGVSHSKTNLSLVEGGSETLTATVAPSNATNKTVSWKSSDASTASVDANGKVTAVKAGSATITVTTADGSKTATCSVTVTSKNVSVTDVTLDKTEAALTQGETVQLTATVKPDDATDKTLTWSTSDSKVATVDETGKVTAVETGSATITAKAGDKTATCAVTVTAKAIEVTEITLDKTEVEIIEGETAQLTATVKPDDATDKSIEWTSSDENVATVDNSGKVTAISEGKVTITVKTSNLAQSASCDITVKAASIPVTGVNIDSWIINIGVNETSAIAYTIQPENATNKEVSFSSDNTDVVAVDSEGTLVGISSGSAKVIVTTVDGGFSSVCTVNVVGSVGTIEVDGFFYKDYGTASLELIPDPSGIKKYSGDITIPGKVTYKGIEYTVESIGVRMFNGNDELRSVTIEPGVREIDAYAFSGCENLEKVVLPSTLEDYDRSNEVFAFCPKLEIEVDTANKIFFVKDGGLYQDIWGKHFLRWIPEKLTGTFTIAEGTTDLEEFSVFHTSIDKLVIPTSVNFIKERFLCGECKTPLEIVLDWKTIAEVNTIQNYYDDPTPFYLNGTDRSKITVSVPTGTKAFYQAHWLWGACGSIVERP